MIILFEGADNTGKTTIIKELSKRLNINYENFEQLKVGETWSELNLISEHSI